MWTSVPQTPARRTRMRTSSSRILGSATSLSLKPGDADSFTSAFTSENSVGSRKKLLGRGAFLTCSLRGAFGSDDRYDESTPKSIARTSLAFYIRDESRDVVRSRRRSEFFCNSRAGQDAVQDSPVPPGDW